MNTSPTDFTAFQASRRRFLDGVAEDALLREVARGATRPVPDPEEDAMDPSPVVVEGELTVLTAERRLILGYFAPGQRDLADVVRHELGFHDEAFGVGQVGRVRITIEPLPADHGRRYPGAS